MRERFTVTAFRAKRRGFDTEKHVLWELRRLPLIGWLLVSGEGSLRARLLKRLVLSCVFASILAVPVWLVIAMRKNKAEAEVDPAKIAHERLYHAPEGQAHRATLDRYLRAKSMEELLRLVRAPEIVGPKMAAWYARRPEEPLRSYTVVNSSIRAAHGKSFIIFDVLLEPGGRKRTVVLERLSENEFLVDWEVSADYQPMDWEEFRRTKPTSPVPFRAALQPGDYYNWSFSDREKLECWRILHPSQPDLALFGYVERDGELSRELNHLRERAFLDALVELAYPEDAPDPNQVRIVRIVSPSWMVDYPRK